MRFFLFIIIMSTVAVISCNNNNSLLQMKWKEAAVLPGVNGKISLGYAGPVTGTVNNKIIIAGGANFPDSMPWLGGKKKYYDEVFVYEQKDSALQLSQQQYKLPEPIAYPAVYSTAKGIVYAGGENNNGLSVKAWLINLAANDSLHFISLPALPAAVTNAALTAVDHFVYLAGGETADGVSSKFYTLDLNDTLLGWKELAVLPKPTSHGLLIAQSGGLYFIGGRMKTKTGISDLYASVYFYDFSANQWIEKKSIPYALSAGTGVAYQSNKILLFGGDKGETFHKAEQLIAAIAAEKDSVKKEQLVQQKISVQSTHPGFSKQVLLYNTEKDVWTVAGEIPFHVPATTTAFISGGFVFIPSGEIKAGVRSNQILQLHLNE